MNSSRAGRLTTGEVSIEPARRGEAFEFDGKTVRALFGPRWRMVIIGSGQLSRALAPIAQALDFEVICCDPREEYGLTWDVPGSIFSTKMPDDLVVELQPDAHTAVVAVTHDPKLDDMALLEALKSPAFYVGALGSRLNTSKRQERLALFDLPRRRSPACTAPSACTSVHARPPKLRCRSRLKWWRCATGCSWRRRRKARRCRMAAIRRLCACGGG